MISFVAFAFAAAAGVLITRGRLRNLGELHLRGEVPILVLFAAQALARGRLAVPIVAILPWNPVRLWQLILAVLLLMLLLNWQVRGIPLVAAGVLLNLIVVTANGFMPVARFSGSLAALEAGRTGGSFYSAAPSRLTALGDVVSLNAPGAGGFLLSSGDVLLLVGVVVVVVHYSLERPAERVRSGERHGTM